MCLCIVPVSAALYGTVFSECLHIVRGLSVTLSPFIVSTRYPKCSHINNLRVAGVYSISSCF